MALNDRYLNPQMGRILRTLGFDRTWVGGDRAHLIDADGERYLDLISGYGVFALGRNHPDVIAAVQDVLAAGTANLPQLGVTLLSGVLAEQLLARAPGSVAAMVPANTGTEAVEAAMKIARAATGRPRLLYADHAFHGLTLGSLSLNGNDEFRAGFGPLLPGCDRVPFGDADALERELARGDVAALIIEPVQGKGVHLPPDGYLADGAAAVPPGGGAVRVRRGPDRPRAHRAVPGARALGSRPRHDLPGQGAVRRARPDRSRARLAGRRSTACSTAWSAPCATGRRSAATTSRPPRRSPRCGCSSATASSPTPSGWGRCCSS